MIHSPAESSGTNTGKTPTMTSDLGHLSPAAPFYGRLDPLDGTLLRGWVMSIANPGAAISLLVSAGGAQAEIVPDREGEAFGALLGRRVPCRFEVDLAVLFPDSDLAGKAVTVRIAATGHHLENTPQTIAGLRVVKANVDRVEGSRIIGWAVNTQDEAETVEIEVLMDGQPAGFVPAGLQRRDLLSAFATCDHGFEIALKGPGGSLHLRDRRSGAIVFGPLDVLFDGRTDDADGAVLNRLDSIADLLMGIRAELPRRRRFASYPLSDYGSYFRDHYAETAGRRTALAGRAASAAADGPLFSVLMVTCDPPLRLLAEAVASVAGQLYGQWELCIVDDASWDDGVRELLRREAARDARIRVAALPERQGFCRAANHALEMAGGSHAAFLGQDDRLAFDGLLRMAEALRGVPVPVLYSDEDRIAPDGEHADPVFKADFDPELLRSIDCIGQLLVVERRLLARLGGFRPGFEGAHGHDLLFRLYEAVGGIGIRHVPRILYHRRAVQDAGPDDTAGRAAALERTGACVREHLARTGIAATVTAGPDAVRKEIGPCVRVHYPLPATAPRVSVVVPTKDAAALTSDCITSLIAQTDYPDFEIVLVDHDSADPASRPCFERLAIDPRIRLATFHGPFNWAAINNAAVRECRGEVLCFLNNDVLVAEGGWLQDMVSCLSRPGIGAVGAKLLYANGTVQHGGVVAGVGCAAEHAFVGLGAGEPGYLGLAALPRTVSAVTGACLVTTRTVFHAVGGFEMVNLPVAYADVDYCLKLRQAGLQVVWSPHALLYHLETQTRGADDTPEKAARLAREAEWLRGRWKRQMDDPFYNPHFEPFGPAYHLLRPPRESGGF